jgi:hypothetical protein
MVVEAKKLEFDMGGRGGGRGRGHAAKTVNYMIRDVET